LKSTIYYNTKRKSFLIEFFSSTGVVGYELFIQRFETRGVGAYFIVLSTFGIGLIWFGLTDVPVYPEGPNFGIK
jgi:hypothetical protein